MEVLVGIKVVALSSIRTLRWLTVHICELSFFSYLLKCPPKIQWVLCHETPHQCTCPKYSREATPGHLAPEFYPRGGLQSPVTPAVVPDRCPLARRLSNVQQGQPSDVKKTMTSAIKAEMQLFANTVNRGPLRCLQKAYKSDINSGSVRRGWARLLGCWCLVH